MTISNSVYSAKDTQPSVRGWEKTPSPKQKPDDEFFEQFIIRFLCTQEIVPDMM